MRNRLEGQQCGRAAEEAGGPRGQRVRCGACLDPPVLLQTGVSTAELSLQ